MCKKCSTVKVNHRVGREGSSRKKKKAYLDAVRNVPCLDCGGVFPPVAMDFDHVGQKTFGIMNRYGDFSMEEIIFEISKCEIVCANCHRVRTASRRG